jgi:hypothetical protein
LHDYVAQTWGEWNESLQRTRFLEHSCAEHSLILMVEGRDVGVLRVERGSDEWFLDAIEILPEWQGGGTGTCVIWSVLAEAAGDQQAEDSAEGHGVCQPD